MRKFKNDLPVDCPEIKFLTYTKDFEGYHIAQSMPPGVMDFRTHIQKGKHAKKHQMCQGSGLSVLEKLKDAIQIASTFPENGQYILKGLIRYEVDGIVKITPSNRTPSHHTWYPFSCTIEADVFKTLAETLEGE